MISCEVPIIKIQNFNQPSKPYKMIVKKKKQNCKYYPVDRWELDIHNNARF